MGLLKTLDPLLTADVLWVLRSMGHGDKVLVCDCNFPAYSTAKFTTSGKVIVVQADLPKVVGAVLSLLPLDFFCGSAMQFMINEESGPLPAAAEEVQSQVTDVVFESIGADARDEILGVRPLTRFRFYDEAKTCFAVIQTSERRPYANFIFTKGAIGPDGQDLLPEPS